MFAYVTAIDDFVLADAGIPPAPITKASTRYGRSVRRREGRAASVFAGASADPAQWQVIFQCPDLAARDALMAALDVFEEEVRLLAQRNAHGQDPVTTRATISNIEIPGALENVHVRFETEDSVWQAASPTRSTGQLLSTKPLSHAIHIDVGGHVTTSPVLRLTPTVQRSGGDANAGWRYRQRWTITNNGDEPWFRFPVRVSLGATTNLVSGGKARSDGNDVRVLLDGVEQARTLVSWNAAASHIWIVIPACAPGGSITYDLIYGNASAGSPPALAYPDLPAFDLATSTNAQWVYKTNPVVGNAGKGLWHLSDTTEGAIADFSVPGAWSRELTWTTPTNTDNFVQSAFSVQTSWVQPLLEAFRWHSTTGAVLFAAAEEEAGWNPFDGVTLAHPLGITSINFGFKWQNLSKVLTTRTVATDNGSGTVTTVSEEVQTEANAVTRFVVIGRRNAAESWRVISQFTAKAASLTTVGAATYTPTGGAVKAIGLACWPLGVASIPANYNAGVRAVSNTDTLVNIDTSDLAIALSEAETEVYEFATELRLGGGGNAQPHYETLLVGNARGDSGEGTPRVLVPLTQTLVIDQDDGLHGLRLEDSAGLEVEHVSQHTIRGLRGVDGPEGLTEFYTSRWLPLRPPRQIVPNGDFAVDIGGWSLLSATSGMTVALGHEPTLGGEALGALLATITPNSAASGAQARIVSGRFFQVGTRETVEIAAWSRTSNANLRPLLAVAFSTDDDALLSVAIEALWLPTINTGYRRVFAARVPHNATRYRAMLVVQTAASSATGAVAFDDVTLNDAELYVADIANGTFTVEVDVPGRYV